MKPAAPRKKRRRTRLAVLSGNGYRGYFDGSGGAGGTAELSYPAQLAIDADGFLYVGDTGNGVIRRIDPASGDTTTFAGSGGPGFADGPAAAAMFQEPFGLVIAPDGSFYVGDLYRIRAIRRVPRAGR